MDEPLREAKRELRSAEKALGRMRDAPNFEDFEDAWLQFVGALRKVWVKTERGCQHVRKRFEPWQGGIKNQRRKDQLLRYLDHARNADQHSLQLIVEDVPEQTVTVNGDKVVVGNDVVVIGPRIELRPVEDCGVRYDPPTEHLGKALKDPGPVEVAELGLHFYARFVETAERKFFA
jgi:hypothetical protein